MLGKKRKTLYETLGVGADATLAEIEDAYRRRRAEMSGPDTWIHPVIAAKVRLAYETLRQPAKREAYDRTLRNASTPPAAPPGDPAPAASDAMLTSVQGGQANPAHSGAPSPEELAPMFTRPRERRARRSGWWGFGLGLGAVVALAAGALGYFLRDGALTRADKEYTGAEIAEKVAPYLGRVEGALPGETRDLGLALAMAENEMVAPCRDVPAGMVLTLRVGTVSSRAELARAREDLGLCVIGVRGGAPELTLRSALPPQGEALYAITREAGGPPLPLRVSAGPALAGTKGAALQIEAQALLPNGTPIFDSQARLAGLVAQPHGFGEGIVAALGAARVADVRR